MGPPALGTLDSNPKAAMAVTCIGSSLNSRLLFPTHRNLKDTQGPFSE